MVKIQNKFKNSISLAIHSIDNFDIIIPKQITYLTLNKYKKTDNILNNEDRHFNKRI